MNKLFPDWGIKSGAYFSEDRVYRYSLWRQWNASLPNLGFVMLNPSTADEETNDPTVERCEKRARMLGFGGLIVANIFALRSTDPEVLYHFAGDPVGELNDTAIVQIAFSCDIVVCAWGTHGALNNRGAQVLELLASQKIKPWVLGLNKDGSPMHPLYMGYDVMPRPLEETHVRS